MKIEAEKTSGHGNNENGGKEAEMEQEVKTTIKYVPTTLTPNINPSSNVSAIEINKKYIKETLGGGFSVALAKAIKEGEDKLVVMAAKRCQEL